MVDLWSPLTSKIIKLTVKSEVSPRRRMEEPAGSQTLEPHLYAAPQPPPRPLRVHSTPDRHHQHHLDQDDHQHQQSPMMTSILQWSWFAGSSSCSSTSGQRRLEPRQGSTFLLTKHKVTKLFDKIEQFFHVIFFFVSYNFHIHIHTTEITPQTQIILSVGGLSKGLRRARGFCVDRFGTWRWICLASNLKVQLAGGCLYMPAFV